MGSAAFGRSWYAVIQDVKVSPAANHADEFAGRLTELCADRIRFVVPRWIEPGCAADVRWNQTLVRGMVELCHPCPEGYTAEMRLDDVRFESDVKAAAWRVLFEEPGSGREGLGDLPDVDRLGDVRGGDRFAVG